MAVFASRTRAAPMLHVSILSRTVCGVVRGCFDSTNPAIYLTQPSLCRVYAKDMREAAAMKPPFLRVLSFSEVLHTQLGRGLARTTTWRNRLFPMGKEFFGTDGIRGVPGTPPLDDATLYATGRSLGAYLKRQHGKAHVLIGMDTRESGAHIASLLAAGLAQSGASVAFAGVITTPGVACLVRQNDFQAGVVVSASHNPFYDNGVKLFSHAGMKFPDAVEEELEADIFSHRSGVPPKNIPTLVADESLDAEYLSFLRGRVIPGAKLAGLRIVLDCANGAAYKLGPELFRSLGANVVAIDASPDGRNINAGCGSLHLEGLQKRVAAERATLGVAFDGDADRALFVCASGKIINGD